VGRLRATSIAARTLWVAIFALLLTLRLLSPAGFMPAFERGSVTIVICPDADAAVALTTGHHGHDHKHHQTCPYAAAAASGSLATDWPLLAAFAIVGLALRLGLESALLIPRRGRERPPLRGPPFPV
jgi:hypothetical protein